MQNLRVALSDHFDFYSFGVFGEISEKMKSSAPEESTTFLRPGTRGLGAILHAGLRFARQIRQIKPDLVLINCEAAELFYALFAPRTKCFLIHHIEPKFAWIKNPKIGKCVRLILKIKSARSVYISESLRNLALEEDGIVLENVHNFMTAERTKLAKESTERRVVFVGRLHPQKQPEIVIELCNELKKTCVFFGDGPQLSNLKFLANKNNVESFFMGFQKNIWSLVNSGDVLVLPSAYEGKPMVINEALFHGLHVIVYRLRYLEHEFPELPVVFVEDFTDLIKEVDKCFAMRPRGIEEIEQIRFILSKRNTEVISRWKETILSVL
jgi:glycosyltransferase involved in cell wall biosynthesis